MKLTKDGKTLFVALCDLFTNKVGAAINKKAFGNNSTLVAVRNKEGAIEKITLLLHKNKILEINSGVNEVFVDSTSWFTKLTMNRLNKVLSFVDLDLFQRGEGWAIRDASGQISPFQNAAMIDLTRPHGASLYQIEEKV